MPSPPRNIQLPGRGGAATDSQQTLRVPAAAAPRFHGSATFPAAAAPRFASTGRYRRRAALPEGFYALRTSNGEELVDVRDASWLRRPGGPREVWTLEDGVLRFPGAPGLTEAAPGVWRSDAPTEAAPGGGVVELAFRRSRTPAEKLVSGSAWKVHYAGGSAFRIELAEDGALRCPACATARHQKHVSFTRTSPAARRRGIIRRFREFGRNSCVQRAVASLLHSLSAPAGTTARTAGPSRTAASASTGAGMGRTISRWSSAGRGSWGSGSGGAGTGGGWSIWGRSCSFCSTMRVNLKYHV